MSLYVFLGPTLALEEARSILEAFYLPPVSQGDVYRLVTLGRPKAIAIVDGYFNQVPAVWHKEILWAMSEGIPVYGAASMGALRAAELAPFGMRGVGRIFEAYRDGVLPPYGGEPFEDDDEVAVLHGPPETGYVGLSESMVNIRCSLAAASSAKLVSKSTRDELLRLAKQVFYADRNYEGLLAQAGDEGLPSDEISALKDWLKNARVDQKRDDARQLLHVLRENFSEGVTSVSPDYSFEQTSQWQTAVSAIESELPASNAALDELRLQGPTYFSCRRQVLGMLLAVPTETGSSEPLETLRTALSTPGNDAFAAEIGRFHEQPDALDDLWRRERSLRQLHDAVTSLPRGLLERHLVFLLEETGEYARLRIRAERKRRVIAEDPARSYDGELSGLQELQLQDWYFAQRLGREIPEDIGAYVTDLGFPSVREFNQALLREYHFLQTEESSV